MVTSRFLKIIGFVLLGLVGTAVIAWLNFQIISSWFGKAGPANLGSIEVSYVSMGRFLVDFGLPIAGLGNSWAPFWYFGFPFHLFYTPLLPLLEAVIHKIYGISLWEAYRAITGVSFILVPVSVFLLGWQLSRRFVGGLVSGVLYTVIPSIFYFILPEVAQLGGRGEVAADRFSADFLDPRRFVILVRWGEGPHTLSLVFAPLAGFFFAKFLDSRNFVNLLVSSLFLGLAALANPLGLFASLLLIASMSFVKFAQKREERFRTVSSMLFLILLSLGLISFWYNPSFLTSFFVEGEGILGRYLSFFPWGWLLALFFITFIFWFLKRILRDFGVATTLVWFLILFTVVGTYYFSASPQDSSLRIELLPQALRYMTEVDMALSLLLGVIFAAFFRSLGKRHVVFEFLGFAAGVILVAGLIWYVKPFLPFAAKAAGGVVNLEKTREKEIASWILQNVELQKGERVFVPGNYGFYLNWFSDVWQSRGGLFQAATHPWPDHIYYQLANGEDAEIAKSWLMVINAKYAVVTTPASSELYKEIKNLERFEGLSVAYSASGDIIYEVPLNRSSLAKPVNLQRLRTLVTPLKADDKTPLLAYADWVQNSSNNTLDFEMLDNDTYKIRGKIGEAEAILVQMTADAGWRASNRGKGVRTGRDTLGFLLLYPEPGQVDITLNHVTSWKEWLGYLTTSSTVLVIIWYFFRKRFQLLLPKNETGKRT